VDRRADKQSVGMRQELGPSKLSLNLNACQRTLTIFFFFLNYP
jgi:hypothetical protein